MTDRPIQLGYWMGYRIAEAYYNSTPDKAKAIEDLLNIHDYERIIEAYSARFSNK